MAPPGSESRLPAPPGSLMTVPSPSSGVVPKEEPELIAPPQKSDVLKRPLWSRLISTETPAPDFIQPDCPLDRALTVVMTQPEARALFESPLQLERLPLPDETKAFIRVLTNPQTGSVVYLIGTAHVSNASRDDVRMLIEAVGPDVVAVELDEARLWAIDHGYFLSTRVPTTTWKVLTFVWSSPGGFLEFWATYLQTFIAQALGADYACDLQSAVQTARRLQIPIETIDINESSTKNKLRKELNKQSYADHLHTFQGLLKEEDDSEVAKKNQQEIDNLTGACEDFQAAEEAYARVLLAFDEGRPLPLADVAAYRPCGKKMAEKLRLDAINRKVDESAFGPGVTKAIVDDRDWFMAQNLAILAAEHRKVVAVVGAFHVPGIRARFPELALWATNTEGKAKNEKWISEAKRQALDQQEASGVALPTFNMDTARTAAMYAGAAAVGAFAVYKRPRLVRNFGAGALLTGGTVQLGLAAMTAKWTQLGAYLDGATQLERNESTEGVAITPSFNVEKRAP